MSGPASIAPVVNDALANEATLVLAQTWALVAARLLPVLTFTPLLGGQAVAARLRVAVVALFAGVLSLGIVGTGVGLSQSVTLPVLFALAAKEIAVGVVLALMVDLIFQTLVAAGQLVDFQRGASIAQVFDPLTRRQSSPFASFFLQFAIVLFVTFGVHRFLVAGLAGSFTLLPLGLDVLPALAARPTADLVIDLSAGLLVLAMQLASPVIVMALLIDLTLGLANKASPNIQMFFLSLGVKPWLGLAAAAAGLGLTMEISAQAFADRFVLIQQYLSSLARLAVP